MKYNIYIHCENINEDEKIVAKILKNLNQSDIQEINLLTSSKIENREKFEEIFKNVFWIETYIDLNLFNKKICNENSNNILISLHPLGLTHKSKIFIDFQVIYFNQEYENMELKFYKKKNFKFSDIKNFYYFDYILEEADINHLEQIIGKSKSNHHLTEKIKNLEIKNATQEIIIKEYQNRKIIKLIKKIKNVIK